MDDQLRLLVDGSEVRFDAPTTYDSEAMGAHVPHLADLSPVGVAGKEADLLVSHLKVLRDIYYIADQGGRDRLSDFVGRAPDLADSATWQAAYDRENVREVPLVLAPKDPRHPENDQFLVLGDNSAQSKDSRLWPTDPRNPVPIWVSRQMLTGEALFIYWPHSWDELPGTHIPCPFFPNFKRMHLVH